MAHGLTVSSGPIDEVHAVDAVVVIPPRVAQAGVMPAGSILAKDSFAVNGKGNVTVGPLFLMEKMPAGFKADSGDWKYTMIMPNGSVFGVTNAENSAGMQFCIECHAAVAEEQDHMMFLPEDYRTR